MGGNLVHEPQPNQAGRRVNSVLRLITIAILNT